MLRSLSTVYSILRNALLFIASSSKRWNQFKCEYINVNILRRILSTFSTKKKVLMKFITFKLFTYCCRVSIFFYILMCLRKQDDGRLLTHTRPVGLFTHVCLCYVWMQDYRFALWTLWVYDEAAGHWGSDDALDIITFSGSYSKHPAQMCEWRLDFLKHFWFPNSFFQRIIYITSPTFI